MKNGFGSHSPNSRVRPVRIGKTKKNSYIMRACARYLEDKGPSTVKEIFYNAKFKNGKCLNAFSSTGTLANVMKMRHDFFVAGSDGDYIKAPKLWMVRKDSELLQ